MLPKQKQLLDQLRRVQHFFDRQAGVLAAFNVTPARRELNNMIPAVQAEQDEQEGGGFMNAA